MERTLCEICEVKRGTHTLDSRKVCFGCKREHDPKYANAVSATIERMAADVVAKARS